MFLTSLKFAFQSQAHFITLSKPLAASDSPYSPQSQLMQSHHFPPPFQYQHPPIYYYPDINHQVSNQADPL